MIARMPVALIVALILLAGLGLAVWWYFRPITVAYRLTVEVRVNGETFTGSGVIATDWSRNANLLALGDWAFHQRGEAVTVDLGRYGPLFLTLRGRYFAWQLPMIVYGVANGSEDLGGKIRSLTQPGPAVEIPREALPRLVVFHDITQPGTVECVDPAHMDAAFPSGSGVTLVHASLAVVNEPVTSGTIEKRLPWLALPRLEMEHLMTGPVWNSSPGFGPKQCQLIAQDLEAEK